MNRKRMKTNQILSSIQFHNVDLENIGFFIKESILCMKGKEGEEVNISKDMDLLMTLFCFICMVHEVCLNLHEFTSLLSANSNFILFHF